MFLSFHITTQYDITYTHIICKWRRRRIYLTLCCMLISMINRILIVFLFIPHRIFFSCHVSNVKREFTALIEVIIVCLYHTKGILFKIPRKPILECLLTLFYKVSHKHDFYTLSVNLLYYYTKYYEEQPKWKIIFMLIIFQEKALKFITFNAWFTKFLITLRSLYLIITILAFHVKIT